MPRIVELDDNASQADHPGILAEGRLDDEMDIDLEEYRYFRRLHVVLPELLDEYS